MSFMMALKTLPVGVKILGGAALSYGAFSWLKNRSPSNQAVNNVVDGVLPPDVEKKVVNAINSTPNIAALGQLGDGLAKAGSMQLANLAHSKAAMMSGVSMRQGPAISKLPPPVAPSTLVPVPSISGVADMLTRALNSMPPPATQGSGASTDSTASGVGNFIASLTGGFHIGT